MRGGGFATGPLLAILSNPPETDGQRTIGRVDLASTILGFEGHRIVNLFAHASRATREIETLGADEAGWLQARPAITQALEPAGGVLLGYGTTAPAGPAGQRFRAQVDWLEGHLSARELPVWQLGDGPRHPSRWQRWTSRAHPSLPFDEAVRRSLVRVGPGTARGRH